MKIKVRSYLGGGLMASIYLPVTTTQGALGANSALIAVNLLNSGTTASGLASSKGSSDKGGITEKDLYTGLYKTIAELGLMSDSLFIISKLQQDMFNDNLLDPFGDSSDMTNKYLKALSYVNMAKSNQKLYDAAYLQAVASGSLLEAAVTSSGGVVVKDLDGNMNIISPDQYRKNPNKYMLMTNGNLLAERMNNPLLAFKNSLLEIVLNGTSMKEIALTIDNFVKNLGSSKTSLDKYTDDATILDGLDKLKLLVQEHGAEATMSALKSGQLYKIGIQSKSNALNILAAIDAIYNILPKSLKTLLELHGGKAALALLLSPRIDSEFTFSIDAEKDPEGKSGKSSGNGGGSKGAAEMNYAEILYYGSNEPEIVEFGVKNNVLTALGRRSHITNYLGESKGSDFAYSELYNSQVGSVLKLDLASFGDVPINKSFKDKIIVDNDEIVGVDLPYKELQDGRIVPNFELLSKIREVDDKILKLNLSPSNPADIARINKLYTDEGLPIKYSVDGNGLINLTGNYKRFAAIEATADELALMGGYTLSNPTLETIDDDAEKEEYIRKIREITKDKKYDLGGGFLSSGRHLVKGTIFIPIGGSAIDARMASSSGKLTGGTTDYDTLRGVDYAVRNYQAPQQTNLTL